MNDQFDKRLVGRINDVFENFEDDSAAEGWQKLQAQLPVKRKKRAAIWWFSSAAALLLLAGLWITLDPNISEEQPKETKHYQASHQHRPKAQEPTHNTIHSDAKADYKKPKPIDEKAAINERINPNPEQRKVAVTGAKMASNSLLSTNLREQPSDILESAGQGNNEFRVEKSLTPIVVEDKENQIANTETAVATESPLHTVPFVDGIELNQSGEANPKIVSLHPLTPRELISNPPPANISSEKEEKTLPESKTETRKSTPRSKKDEVTLAIQAGSFFNYSQGSQSNVNSSLGLTSEFRISRKLKFVTGVSLGRNSLTYDNMIPREAANSYYSAPSSKANLDVINNYYSQTFTPVAYTINSYDAKLLGLDIPLNLKYTLKEAKHKIYVTTGFSSNVFIDESYTYSVKYQTTGIGGTTIPSQQTTTRDQSFDFARMFNLSFGLNYPLSRKTAITFEPFMKHPLSGLGSQNLKFGAAGLNLILTFDTIK